MKTTANHLLATLLTPLVGPQTAVLALQNSLGNEEHLAALVGAERILGAVCYFSVTREAPGEINGYYTPGAMTLGEFGRPAGERVRTVAGLFAGIGVKANAVDNLAEARWQKIDLERALQRARDRGRRHHDGSHSRTRHSQCRFDS